MGCCILSPKPLLSFMSSQVLMIHFSPRQPEAQEGSNAKQVEKVGQEKENKQNKT